MGSFDDGENTWRTIIKDSPDCWNNIIRLLTCNHKELEANETFNLLDFQDTADAIQAAEDDRVAAAAAALEAAAPARVRRGRGERAARRAAEQAVRVAAD